jgi:hypothetical protein
MSKAKALNGESMTVDGNFFHRRKSGDNLLRLLLTVLLMLAVMALTELVFGFLEEGSGLACASPAVTTTWERNDNRPNRGCGNIDKKYAKDPAQATRKDANVNRVDGIDRYIGRLVVKDDGNVIMYVELWCIDNSFYAVRVKQEEKPDRCWMT